MQNQLLPPKKPLTKQQYQQIYPNDMNKDSITPKIIKNSKLNNQNSVRNRSLKTKQLLLQESRAQTSQNIYYNSNKINSSNLNLNNNNNNNNSNHNSNNGTPNILKQNNLKKTPLAVKNPKFLFDNTQNQNNQVDQKQLTTISHNNSQQQSLQLQLQQQQLNQKIQQQRYKNPGRKLNSRQNSVIRSASIDINDSENNYDKNLSTNNETLAEKSDRQIVTQNSINSFKKNSLQPIRQNQNFGKQRILQDITNNINNTQNNSDYRSLDNKTISHKQTRLFQDFQNKKKIQLQQQQWQQQYKQYQEGVQIIPRNINITQQQMKERKYMDQRRWFCMSRPQYPRSCGISSLTSCFNFLFSTLGCGELPPISTEEAIERLGIVKGNKMFKDVDFGNFTGNITLIKWWQRLLKIFNLEGNSYMFWKARGQDQTKNRTADQALNDLKKGLQSENMTFIYHAYDHYFCPIGFEETPGKAIEAYKTKQECDQKTLESWIIIGETARTYPCFHTRKWSDIAMDIQLESPNYYNIREPQKGVMQRKKKTNGNMHCIMAFTKRQRKITKPPIFDIKKKRPETSVNTIQGQVQKYDYDINCNIPLNTETLYDNSSSGTLNQENDIDLEDENQQQYNSYEGQDDDNQSFNSCEEDENELQLTDQKI